MTEETKVPLFDLIMSLSGAMDLVSPAVVNHHKQVAYITLCIAEEMGLSREERDELALAAAMHDVGAFYLKERLDLLHFEVEDPHRHAECGFLLLNVMPPFQTAANHVRFHHVPWNQGRGIEFRGQEVSVESHILHLADRVAVSVDKERCVLGQIQGIRGRIEDASGNMFNPELVEAFQSVAARESFWLDTVSPTLDAILTRKVGLGMISIGDLTGLTKVFSRIIDFRSEFTATHSGGVAATAEALAKLAGFSASQCQAMRVAGYLHDIGKLAVAAEILEKPAKLSEDEIHLIRSHTYFTYRTLEPIDELEEINTWASYHHEHLDGSGYPFHIGADDLSPGARIMAVADVFTAITEDRPYRPGMSDNQAMGVLISMANNAKLDKNIVGLVMDYFGEINSIREVAQRKAAGEHQQFLQQLG